MKSNLVFIGIVFIILLGIFYFVNPNFTDNVVKETEELDTIIIPVKVHVIRDPGNVYTSYRDRDNIVGLFAEANRILGQAEIYLSIEEIVITDLETSAVPNALNGVNDDLVRNENFDFKKFNFFMAQSLNGINGIALYRINSALIADFTSVNDFRTTAHELGHLLGLKHVNPSNRLMAQGKNGELLSEDEIRIARASAKELMVFTKPS